MLHRDVGTTHLEGYKPRGVISASADRVLTAAWYVGRIARDGVGRGSVFADHFAACEEFHPGYADVVGGSGANSYHTGDNRIIRRSGQRADGRVDIRRAACIDGYPDKVRRGRVVGILRSRANEVSTPVANAAGIDRNRVRCHGV